MRNLIATMPRSVLPQLAGQPAQESDLLVDYRLFGFHQIDGRTVAIKQPGLTRQALAQNAFEFGIECEC